LADGAPARHSIKHQFDDRPVFVDDEQLDGLGRLVIARIPNVRVAERMGVEIFYPDAFMVVAGMQSPWWADARSAWRTLATSRRR